MSGDTARILAERATALASPPPSKRSNATLEVLELVIAGARFAIPIRDLRGVQKLDQLTPIPCTPSHIAGVMNIHGELVAALDIRRLLSVREDGIANYTKVVVLEGGGMTSGIFVDSVDRITSVDEVSMRSGTGHLLAVSATGLGIIDALSLLADETIAVNEHVTTHDK